VQNTRLTNHDVDKLIVRNENITNVKHVDEVKELIKSMESIMIEDYLNFINKYKFSCFIFSKEFDYNIWVKLLICCNAVKFYIINK